MKQKIIALAKDIGISKVGFCAACDYVCEPSQKPLLASADFGKKPDEILKNAKSIIVCAFNYYTKAQGGNISRYARGLDYHSVTKEKLSKIVELLEENGFSAKAFADVGGLNERFLARLSGIAFIGKNQMAINDDLGSFFFIGYVITDCEIEKDRENTNSCMNCGKCIDACPLSALSDDGFCEERCLSYITQKKGELSETEKKAVFENSTIWGCDICQNVCPHNKNLAETDIDEFKSNIIVDLNIDENMSNREFLRQYKDRAFSWRGKSVLVRNQKITKKYKK